MELRLKLIHYMNYTETRKICETFQTLLKLFVEGLENVSENWKYN